ncbi:type VII secretion target [Paractinoplanes atraurantiacus]|uniref:Excreted virulence factor EspC, type VII ESX diderm n=1 Tax=Paractinoplanes atraurantiacus TaxID=1036182 RepID=A0A285J4W4_9ACTN|nr:type VII secretion target [Actinoplanes atraurantiacus]SNY54897.1 Excreted virulence factor EspC, type VII ESX diderm [Actinoplanes atraurantiacus]
MTGDSGFQAQAAAIIEHAGIVDEVAAQVGQGRSAASVVHMGRDAYGFLCKMIPALLEEVQDSTISALPEAADSLERSADDLRTTARNYSAADDRTATAFRSGPDR